MSKITPIYLVGFLGQVVYHIYKNLNTMYTHILIMCIAVMKEREREREEREREIEVGGGGRENGWVDQWMDYVGTRYIEENKL